MKPARVTAWLLAGPDAGVLPGRRRGAAPGQRPTCSRACSVGVNSPLLLSALRPRLSSAEFMSRATSTTCSQMWSSCVRAGQAGGGGGEAQCKGELARRRPSGGPSCRVRTHPTGQAGGQPGGRAGTSLVTSTYSLPGAIALA